MDGRSVEGDDTLSRGASPVERTAGEPLTRRGPGLTVDV
jgi:hypothetical protein